MLTRNDERHGALVKIGDAFLARGRADVFFAAVRAGGGAVAALKQKVAALGLTTEDHAVHLSLYTA